METKNNPEKASKEDLFSLFDEIGIKATTFEHRPVFTVEEGLDIKEKIKGGHTKNLFLKDKNGDFYLICALADSQIKLNQVHKAIGAARLSFGSEDMMWDLLGVRPGSVTLFSLINDKAKKISLIVDNALLGFDIVNFHPLLNDATTSISQSDMRRFIKNWGGRILVLDFSDELPQQISSPLEFCA